MALTVQDMSDLARLLVEHPEWRLELRRLILSDELITLPELMRQLAEKVDALAEAQWQSEARLTRLEEVVADLATAQRQSEARLTRLEEVVADLAAAQRQSEARLTGLEEAMKELAAAQRETEQQLAALAAAQQQTQERLQRMVSWQEGETGRRDGERYERETLRRAPALFNGGQGGAPDQSWIQTRLTNYLYPRLAADLFEREEDPFLADLIWWKGEQLLVVEISLQVNGYDIVRAARRAGTLQRAGVQASGVVIGKTWADPDAPAEARVQGVEWWVGSEVSEGLRAFRRIPFAPTASD